VITVVDVIKAMGLEPTPALTWSVGNTVRDAYERATGSLPVKALREKTSGVGSHCFAIYPAEWRVKIEEVVKLHRVEASKQMVLL
jgi:hypothetical protein